MPTQTRKRRKAGFSQLLGSYFIINIGITGLEKKINVHPFLFVPLGFFFLKAGLLQERYNWLDPKTKKKKNLKNPNNKKVKIKKIKEKACHRVKLTWFTSSNPSVHRGLSSEV